MSSREASSGSFSRRSRTSSLAVFIGHTSVGHILHRSSERGCEALWFRPGDGLTLNCERRESQPPKAVTYARRSSVAAWLDGFLRLVEIAFVVLDARLFSKMP